MGGRKHISHDDVRFDKLKVGQLRLLCLERGLSDDGLKLDLVKRLTSWSKGKQRQDRTPCPGAPPTPESLDTCECQAIVVAEAEIGDDEHIISSAKKNLSEILKNDGLSVDRSTPTLTVANSHGHTWAAALHEVKSLRAETSSLRAETSSLREVAGMHEITITSLQVQVTNLTLSVQAYAAIRHRFLVNYKQTQMGIMEGVDQRYIYDGNSIAHGGDVKADAELYREAALHQRDDITVFRSLYGCIPLTIWSICKQSLTTEITSL